VAVGALAVVGQTLSPAPGTSGNGSSSSASPLSPSQSQVAAAALLAEGSNQAEHPSPIHGDTWSTGSGKAPTKLTPSQVGEESALDQAWAAARKAAKGKKITGFKQGVSQAVPVLDNSTTTTYANADGTLTAKVYQYPVNYQDAEGAWAPISAQLSVQPDGSIANSGGPVEIRFGGSLSDPDLLTLSSGAESVTLGTPEEGSEAAGGGAFTNPVEVTPVKASISDGDTVDFADAWPTTSLDYVNTLDALTQLLVLQAAPSGTGDVVFRFPLTMSGLSARLDQDGEVDFVSGSGSVAFSLPPGTMGDSTFNEASGMGASTSVSYALGPGGSWLEIIAAGAWLRDPARQYPVTIDPSWATTGNGVFVSTYCPTCNYNGYYTSGESDYTDWIGEYSSSSTGMNWTALDYPALADLDGASIVSATWSGYFDWTSLCSAETFWMWQATQPFNYQTATWNSGLYYTTTGGVTGSVSANWGNVCYGNRNWASVSITPWVQEWTDGAAPNDGIIINSDGNTSSNYWMQLAAYDTDTGGYSNVSVTYNPGSGPTLTSPPSGATVVDSGSGSPMPLLTTSGCGGCSEYYFQVSTDPTFTTVNCYSNWITSSSWQTTSGCLADGYTSYWRVLAENSDGYETNWSSTSTLYGSGPVDWGFQDSAADPSSSAQSGNQPFPPPNTSSATMPVYVVNQGNTPWPAGGSYEISYHVLTPGTQSTVANGVTGAPATGTTSAFPITVNPGAGVWVTANIAAMSTLGLGAGSYQLAFDIYNTQTGEWFSQYGGAVGSFDVLASPPPVPSSPTGGALITPGSGASLEPTLTAAACTSCTGYQFQVSTRSDFGAYVTTSPWESSPSWTVPAGDLEPGETYYWEAIGRDQYSSSTGWSSAATFETPTTPGAPTAVSATGGSGQETVRWTAPSSTGGSAITGYSIIPSLNSQPQPAIEVASSPATLIGLVSGGTYAFTVAAQNAMGTGAPSAPSSGAATLPAQPTGVTAVAGNKEVTVSWQAAPADGSLVTGYTVTTYKGSTKVGTTSAAASATSAVVTGLSNGTVYSLTVSAINATGQGPAAAAMRTQTAVADHPLAFYPLNDTGCCTAADTSGNGNSGTYTSSGVTYGVTGPQGAGSSVSLNGASGYVTLPSSVQIGLPVTLEAWVDPTSCGSNQGAYVIATGDPGAMMSMNTACQLQGQIVISGNLYIVQTASAVVPLDQWSRLDVTISSTGAIVDYVNGVEVASGSSQSRGSVTYYSTDPGAIGADSCANECPNWGNYFPGAISDAGVYAAALTQSQLEGQYTPGPAPQVSVSLSSSQFARGQTGTVTATVTPESGVGTGEETPTFVQGAEATGKTVSLSNSAAAGDLLVLGITTKDSGTDPITGVSDNVNGAWTEALSEPYGNGHVELWYLADSKSGTVTVTVTGASAGLVVAEYSGVVASSPLDQLVGASGSGTTMLAAGPTAAIGGSGELVLGIAGETSVGSGFTAGSGFTLREQAKSTNNYNAGLEDELSASSSGQSMTMGGTTNDFGAIVAVFKPAAAPSSETVNLSIPLGGTGFDGSGGTVSVGGTSCANVAGVSCSVSASQITVTGLSLGATPVTLTATVTAMGSDSACSDPLLTAIVADATTGLGGLGSAQSLICDGGLGAQQWWTFVSTALGPGGTAQVNAADGNLLVTQQDGGTMQLHGDLSLGIVRAYNSEATLQPGAEPVGQGWITSFVSAGDDLGGVALRVPQGEQVSGGVAITLITGSGARVAFEPTALSTPIDLTSLGSTTGPLGPLVPTTLTLGSGYNQLCVDTVYTAEAGVHASMWRYVESSTGGCTGLTASNAQVLGYAVMTTDGVREEYAADGNLLSVRDALGNTVYFTYSGGQLIEVGEDGGGDRAYSLVYTTWSGGTEVNISDPAGEVTSYEDNSAGDLVNVINPNGTQLHYTYGGCGGSAGQLCSGQNPDGNTVTFSYAASTSGGPAVISAVIDLLGTETAYTYGGNGAVVNATTGTEEEQFVQVDSLGRVGVVDEGSTSTTQGGPAGIWLHTTLYDWDTAGSTCQQPDPEPDNNLCEILELGLDNGQTPNRETLYTYNDEGGILVQDDVDSPTNIVTTTSYLAQYVEASGTVRTFTDTMAGDGAVTSAGGPRRDASTVFVVSDQTGVLSPDGNADLNSSGNGPAAGYMAYATSYARDTSTAVGAGLPIGSTDPCSGAGDNTGLLCTQSAPSKDGVHPTVTTYTYDQWGQRLTMTTPDENDGSETGGAYTYTYYPNSATDLSGTTSAGGWLAGVTDPTGEFVAYGYDAEGQVVRTWDRDATAQAGLPLSDYPGTCASPTAPGYTQTLYATSCTGAPGLYALSQTDALGNVTTYQLDADGNQLGVRTARGYQSSGGYPSCPAHPTPDYDTCTTYNAAGEVLTVQQPAEATENGSPHTTNVYDAYGNLIQTTDGMGDITTYSYDAVNRKITETVGRYAVGSGPTPTGCTTSTSAPWPSGGEVICTTTTTYDGEDNVISVQAPASEVSDLVGSNEPTVTTYVYDAYHRVIETITPRWDGTYRTLTSATVHDEDGNVVESCPAREFTEGSGGCHGPGSATTDYFSTYTTYNAADLPVSVTSYTANTPVTGSPTPVVTMTTYDADGNVITATNANGDTATNGYNVLDEMTWTATPQATNQYVVSWHGYDPSGNRTWTAQTATFSSSLPAPGAAPPTTAAGTRDTIVSYDADNRPLDTVVAADATTGTPNVCFDNFASFGVTNTSTCPTLGVTDADGSVDIHTRVSYDADGNQVAQFSADAFQTSATTPNPEYMIRTDFDADDRPITQYVPRYDSSDPNETTLGANAVFSGQASQAAQCPTPGNIPAAPGGAGAPETIPGVPAYKSTTGLCITAVEYDAAGQVTNVLLPTAGGLWSAPQQETFTYTNDGLVAQATSPDPEYPNSALDAPVTVTQTSVYDAQGNAIVTTQPNPDTATGQPATVETTSTYSADGLLLSTTAPSDQSLDLSTGSASAGTLTVDPADTTTYTYDAAGNQLTSTNGYGASTVTQYTANSRKQSVSAPVGTETGEREATTYTYDAVGNVLTVTSPSANDKDATNPGGAPTTYTYSENNLLLSTVTPPGSGNLSLETDNTYNAFGQTLSEHTYEVGTSACPVGGPPSASCDGGTNTDTYYLDGRLASETPEAATGDTVATSPDTFAYDASGNQISASDVGTGVKWGTTDTMSYYLDGSLRSENDGMGDAQIAAQGGPDMGGYTAELSYDGSGDVATLTMARNATSQSTTEALEYNSAEEAVTLGTTADPGATETRSYTESGQLANDIQSNGDITTYSLNPDGSVQQDWLCGSSSTPSGTCGGSSTDVLDWWAYSYDSDGQQTASEAAVSGDNTILNYGYYPGGQVASYSEESQQSSVTGQWTTVNYDADGNRISVGSGSQATTYTYNPNDTLNVTTTSAGSLPDQYDADGRLQSDGCTTYQYDGFNQTYQESTLSSLPAACGTTVTPSSTTTTTYDALSRVATRTDPNGFWDEHYATTGSEVGLIQSGQAAATGNGYGSSENDLALLLDASGTPSQVVGVQGTASSGGDQWLTDDGQGNVGAVTGSASNGAYTCVLKYNIYGSPLQPSSTVSNSDPCLTGYGTGTQLTELGYQFTQRDGTTGDYTFGSRSYDPRKGVFTTPDNYGPASTDLDASIGSDPLTEDTYGYANADPINLKDPDGHGIAGDDGGSCGNILTCTESNGGTGGPVDESTVQAAAAEEHTIQVAQTQAIEQQQEAEAYAPSVIGLALTLQMASFIDPGISTPIAVSAAFGSLFAGASPGVEGMAFQFADDEVANYQAEVAASDARHDAAYFASITSCQGFCVLGQMVAGVNNWIHQSVSGGRPAWAGPQPATPVDLLENGAFLGLQFVPGADLAADGAELGEATDATAVATDEGSSLADDLTSVPCGGQSFSAGSQVALASGSTLAISALRPGTQVLATDPQTGKTQPETVQAVMVNHDTDLMDVEVNTAQGQGTIDSTAHHLFWDLTTKAWTDADQLQSGDQLWTPHEQLATVARTVTVPGAEDMWDLTVASDHDFYVVTVDTAVLVHNCPMTDSNPLSGTTYSPKVLSQMASGDAHSFPSLVDSQADWSDAASAEGGDGSWYLHVNVPGAVNGESGFYQYIVDENGVINHRMWSTMGSLDQFWP
jgi:RHS repeat-associated protein